MLFIIKALQNFLSDRQNYDFVFKTIRNGLRLIDAVKKPVNCKMADFYNRPSCYIIRGKMMSCLSVTGSSVPNYRHIIYLPIIAVKHFLKEFQKNFFKL